MKVMSIFLALAMSSSPAPSSNYYSWFAPEISLEICKTNTVYIPERFGDPLLVSGNDYTWLIMPVMLQGFERDKHMTEIFENVSVEEV